MITVRSLQCNPALVLKWNAGNCKADTVFCTVCFFSDIINLQVKKLLVERTIDILTDETIRF